MMFPSCRFYSLKYEQCACAGATLTAPYDGYNIEQEAVASDPGLFQINVTGGQPGGGLDGSNGIRASPPPLPPPPLPPVVLIYQHQLP